MFYLRFKKKFEKMSELLFFAHFLFFGERCEWIAHFLSESLIHSFFDKKRSQGNQMSEFPALQPTNQPTNQPANRLPPFLLFFSRK